MNVVGRKGAAFYAVVMVLFFCTVIAVSSRTQASVPVLELSETDTEIALWPYMQYKFVADSDDSLENLRASDKGYLSIGDASPDLGYSSQALWVRFRLRNPAALHQHWIINTGLSIAPDLTLFRPSTSGYEAVQIGVLFPYRDREVTSDIQAFRLELPPGSEQVFYLRIQSNFSLHLPFLLQSETRYSQSTTSHVLLYSFFFGVLLAQALYNLVLFLVLRDRSYLLYVCFVLSVVIARVLSLGLAVPWLPSFVLPWQLPLLYISLNAVVLSGLLFARQFLNFKRRPGWQRKVCSFAIGWLLVLMLLSVVSGGQGISAVMNLSALLVNLMIVAFCVSVWGSYRPARFLLLGWSGMLLGGSATLMMNLGWLSMNSLTTQAFPIGMMVDAMALSFALADRIRLLREEKELAQLQLTQGLMQARDRLEYRVGQRTRQLAEARREAEHAIEVKNRYLQLISHDIRSPLTSLKMLQGLIEQSPDKHAELLQHSGPLLDQVVTLIDQLSHVRQIDAQQHWRLEKESVPLQALLNSRLKHHQQALEAKQLRLDNEVDEEATVWAESWLLGGVLDNLIGNAIKFSRPGTVIRIQGPRLDKTLSVCDQGVGMEASLVDQLFRGPVSSRSGTAGEAGQGYGLVLCGEVIQAHHGRLWCESKAGEGSCFNIWLPSMAEVDTGPVLQTTVDSN